MLTVDGTKMGKSLGNFIILKELFKKLDPMILRFYILQGHYRSPLDFTDEALEAASNGYERLKNSIFSLRKSVENYTGSVDEKFEDIDTLKYEFIKAMDDDFNTSKAIAVIYDILKISNTELTSKNKSFSKLSYINNLIYDFGTRVLGFKFDESGADNNLEDKLIEFLITLRNNFRKEKNFEVSDKIRDKFNEIGVTIKDGPEGTTFTK
jgi:cysteinyl-tRNA synthetase